MEKKWHEITSWVIDEAYLAVVRKKSIPKGRLELANAYITSFMNYHLTIMLCPKLGRILFRFLWNGKRSDGQAIHLLSTTAKWRTGHSAVHDAQACDETAASVVHYRQQ